jgi:hypothetical protein
MGGERARLGAILCSAKSTVQCVFCLWLFRHMYREYISLSAAASEVSTSSMKETSCMVTLEVGAREKLSCSVVATARGMQN